MKQKRLKGRKYINLVRCSTDQQADTSPDDQLRLGNEFGDENEMIHAGDDVVLDGITGSIPGARDDIHAVIERKRRRDDFDVLLVQDVSRLTRFGDDHIGYIKHLLAMDGIEVAFVTGGTTGDRDADAMMHSMNGFAAKQQIKAMSYAVVRGQTSAFDSGKIPYSYSIPFGVDRLYIGPNNQPKHRIRNLADGSQQMLAVDSDTVLTHYPPNPKKGDTIHYRRQSDERIDLIPGAPDRIAVVQQIYRRRLIDGWGVHSIALELNDTATPAPRDGLWNTRTIRFILENPIYTGIGVAGKRSCGLYYKRGTTAKPMEVERDLQSETTSRGVQYDSRPESDWRYKQYPSLENYLGQELRDRAKEYHAASLKKDAQKAMSPKVKAKPGGDKHVDSPYVLKGLLRSKQGGYSMTGKLCGSKNNQIRYYRVGRSSGSPTTGSIFSRSIPAEPLEREVLRALREVLLDETLLHQTVAEHLKSQQLATKSDSKNIQPLLSERDEIAERVKDVMLLGANTRKLMQKEFAQWEVRLAHLEQRIAVAQATVQSRPIDIDSTVAAVASQIKKMADSLDNAAPSATRHLLKQLIPTLVVDLETRDVEMEIALPEGMAEDMCLVGKWSQPFANEAHGGFRLKIANFECHDPKKHRNKPPCYVCSRKAA